jgi:hypothetical protein
LQNYVRRWRWCFHSCRCNESLTSDKERVTTETKK